VGYVAYVEVEPPGCGFYLRNIDPMEVLKSGYKVPMDGPAVDVVELTKIKWWFQ